MVSHKTSSYPKPSTKTKSATTSASHTKEFSEQDPRLKRALANHRERQRTEQLNAAFKKLRAVIPSMASDKMSKMHILQIARSYIQYLLCEISDLPTLPPFSELDSSILRTAFNQMRSLEKR
ncbi:helix-loop-helix DNA-binding domain-containing protein [Ditylenchus destructor]|nr:helix-loop-helix DNA-binding domain-containing protein [Ditylenchus destructor]